MNKPVKVLVTYVEASGQLAFDWLEWHALPSERRELKNSELEEGSAKSECPALLSGRR